MSVSDNPLPASPSTWHDGIKDGALKYVNAKYVNAKYVNAKY
jgi:hypothetical protein